MADRNKLHSGIRIPAQRRRSLYALSFSKENARVHKQTLTHPLYNMNLKENDQVSVGFTSN